MKTKNKFFPILLIFYFTISLIGCGSTANPAVGEDVVEGTETTVDSNTDPTTETESKDIVDGKVPNGDKPAEPTVNPTEKPTEPSPTETPAEPSPDPTEKPAEPTPTPHVHDFKVESSVPASCTAEGQVVKVCNCGEKQVEAIPIVEHSWEATTNVIHHEALGHVAQVQVGTTDKRSEYACAFCDARFDSPSGVVDHCLANQDNFDHALARTIIYDYPGEPIYETQWIVDQEAWDETITNYKCSVCGAAR